MATINQHISNLRGLIKEHGRNPGVYTDPQLYELFNGAANRLLRNYNVRLNHNSEWDYEFYPMPLVDDKSHMIGCVTVGCDIKRSQYKIPRALLIRNRSMIDVYTFDYTPIILGNEIDWQNNQYDDVKKNKTNASIINDYLVIWNNKTLKSVLLKGIWEDITQWSSIPMYNDDCELVAQTCYDPLVQDYPLSESFKNDAYDMVLEKLFRSKQLLSDDTNDSNNELKK